MIYQPLDCKEPPVQARKNKSKWITTAIQSMLVIAFLIAMMSIEYWVMYETGA